MTFEHVPVECTVSRGSTELPIDGHFGQGGAFKPTHELVAIAIHRRQAYVRRLLTGRIHRAHLVDPEILDGNVPQSRDVFIDDEAVAESEMR